MSKIYYLSDYRRTAPPQDDVRLVLSWALALGIIVGSWAGIALGVASLI